MFSEVDREEWGAADIGMSIALPDDRRVWLYGDTLSDGNGFVHSTAIVQDGGDLHVSRGGRQLLPNAGATFYWPETVRVFRGDLMVTAAPIKVMGDCLYCFERHATDSRVARLAVTRKGDVRFVKWVRTVPRPEIAGDGEDLEILGPNHYAYWKITHDIQLRDGSWLTSTSQNWDNGFDAHRNPDGSLRYQDWRIIFGRAA
jgi:hypothetical protein